MRADFMTRCCTSAMSDSAGAPVLKDPSDKSCPLVCICIPTFNSARTVSESLRTILTQSYPNILIRASDNASTDDTIEVIQATGGDRVSVFKQAKNLGAEANFTRCIELACGKYTAIFHADDLYEPTMVERQVAYLEDHPDVVAVFTRALLIDEHGIPFGITGGIPGADKVDVQIGLQQLLKATLLHHNFLVCPSAMVRTDVYKNGIGNWGSPAFYSASDVDTWFRLAAIGPIAILYEPLMRYRTSISQFSHLNRTRTKRLDVFSVFEDYLSRNEIRAMLTESDFRHHRWLERHESVALAMNNYALGRVTPARQLLKNVLSWDALRAACSTRRGFVTLAAYLLLRLSIACGASKFSMKMIKAAKGISWRSD